MGNAAKPWASSLAEAKRNATVNFVSSSGTKWTVRPLTLDELAAEDGLPDDLLKVMLLEMIPGGVVAEIAGKISEGDQEAARKLAQDTVILRDRIVLRATVAPMLKPRDLDALDPYDKNEIAAVAQRRLGVDEEGRLTTGLATFRTAGPVG
jgi:hypothetical protein